MDIKSKPSPLKKSIQDKASELGFSACAIVDVATVDHASELQYDKWIADGKHHSMLYLDKYHDIRRNPALLLEGAKSIICVALNYYPGKFQNQDAPQFAYYAYGEDYHEVMRAKLIQLGEHIEKIAGGSWRACVDTAPIRERYWAQQSGLGFLGRNNQLIIPNKGSYFFLGELISTIEIESDQPLNMDCGNCGACISCCPAGALDEAGALDARKCISCLTIEHKGDFPQGTLLGTHIYGCDECQKCCPHNSNAASTSIKEFNPSDEFLNLDEEKIANMNQQDFSRIFRHSAVKRTKLSGLLRNLAAIKGEKAR